MLTTVTFEGICFNEKQSRKNSFTWFNSGKGQKKSSLPSDGSKPSPWLKNISIVTWYRRSTVAILEALGWWSHNEVEHKHRKISSSVIVTHFSVCFSTFHTLISIDFHQNKYYRSQYSYYITMWEQNTSAISYLN